MYLSDATPRATSWRQVLYPVVEDVDLADERFALDIVAVERSRLICQKYVCTQAVGSARIVGVVLSTTWRSHGRCGLQHRLPKLAKQTTKD